MPGEVKNKKLDKVSRSTWARLESAGRSPIGAKPFAAERMDQRDVDPADLAGRPDGAPGHRPRLPQRQPAPRPALAPSARLRRSLDLVERRYSVWLTLPAPPSGVVVGRAVSLLEGFAEVTAVHVDVDGLRVTLRTDATPEEVERTRKVVQGRLASYAQRRLPTYPPDHEPFVAVPRGGSSCSNCRFVSGDLTSCGSPDFRAYYGTAAIPFAPGHDATSSCSDWWEPRG